MEDWSRQTQYDILLKFFYDCVKFWEKELNTDSDLDKTPYQNALKEIPTQDPKVLNGRKFDEKVREDFIKHRYMDTYGKNWETFYKKDRIKEG